MNIGFLGGGQLAKMSALAAFRLGMNVSFYETNQEAPALLLSKNSFVSDWGDKNMLKAFSESVDVITLENEFIDHEVLAYLESLGKKVFPSSQTISKIQDKYLQKKMLTDAGLPVTVSSEINSAEEARNFAELHGYPFLLKTRKQGYDGYGNKTIYKDSDLNSILFELGFPKRKIYAEAFVPFDKELAIILAKNQQGHTCIYPIVETIQKNHICHIVKAPAIIPTYIQEKVIFIAKEIMNIVMDTPILTVELFLTKNGDVLINELAPRPHNSGHYTIEACNISQFETHVRAVSDLPLKHISMTHPFAVMINILGKGKNDAESINLALEHSNATLHIYGKKISRIGRKMGHITITGNNIQTCIDDAIKLEKNIQI